MTLNKYQKANELIHLTDAKKDVMMNRIMAESEPVRRPFPWKNWLAGFAAAAIVLVFVSAGVFRNKAGISGASAPMTESSKAEEVMAAGAESGETAEDVQPVFAGSERMKETAEQEDAVNDLYAAVPEDSSEAATAAGSYTVITDPKENGDALSVWGEKHVFETEGTKVTAYGTQAAEFSVRGTLFHVIFDQPVTEEEMKEAVGEVIRGG